jgi:hypothetical protein
MKMVGTLRAQMVMLSRHVSQCFGCLSEPDKGLSIMLLLSGAGVRALLLANDGSSAHEHLVSVLKDQRD